ncbi:MAG: NAD(P)H-hydrate dehydratase [Actinomycetota bacterium]|nr:NAD(P)H-hydrate dehydratase [Actinomycetota bacterium]
MTPIVTPAEMAAIDAAAAESVDVLIARAGSAVARAARSMMGGTYGRVVNVIAGKGNNGADGRVAGSVLADEGVLVRIVDAADCPAALPPSDLVIDAAYGTGFRGTWAPPNVGGARVLAVDIPSGVDGLTGVAASGALVAERTVTFAALKPGLLFGNGPRLAGRVDVADIGLDMANAAAHRVERSDVVGWWKPRPADAHKWTRAVRVVAGSSGMTGAAELSAGAAMRTGAGIVWLSSPGVDPSPPVEVVGRALPTSGWAGTVLAELARFGVLVVGPGLGRADPMPVDVVDVVAGSPVPVVIDGDGLFAMAQGADGRDAIGRRTASTVLTPHDGEYRSLMGDGPGPDRIDAARRLAAEWSVVALLKGPSTVIAEPGGRVLVVSDGDERLATAGSGDVLSGVIGALIASGLGAFDAAAAGAWIHAAAANALPADGLVASDLLRSLPGLLESLR